MALVVFPFGPAEIVAIRPSPGPQCVMFSEALAVFPAASRQTTVIISEAPALLNGKVVPDGGVHVGATPLLSVAV